MSKLILIGGLPGSGKTFIGKALARRMNATYIDKDCVAGGFVSALLETLGSHADDRESAVYLGRVRPLEYQTMMSLAMDALSCSGPVICSAPFVAEFKSDEWMNRTQREAADLGASVLPVWIRAELGVTRERIISRGEARDQGKLTHWEDYVAKTSPESPSPSIMVIDNTDDFGWKAQLGQIMSRSCGRHLGQ